LIVRTGCSEGTAWIWCLIAKFNDRFGGDYSNAAACMLQLRTLSAWAKAAVAQVWFVRFFPLRCDRAEWPVYG